MNTSTSGPPPGRSAGRFIAGVAGTILGLLAVAFVALGGALVGMHSTHRDADGFYSTGQKTLATPTHALVADKIDAGTGPGWLFRKSRLGTIRVTASGTAAKPVFVGIATHLRRSTRTSAASRRTRSPISRSIRSPSRTTAGRAPSRPARRARRRSGRATPAAAVARP